MKTTTELKKAIDEFKKSGFYIDEYETEKRNINQYISTLTKELNVYNLNLRHKEFNGCYSLEEAYKVVSDYFKDSKIKRQAQLSVSFISFSREYFNIAGYHDNLKLSFIELKNFVDAYLNTKEAITIKRGLYEDYNKDRETNKIKEDFKQFIELCLNLAYDETSFKFKVFNKHVSIILTSDALIKAYQAVLSEYILNYYTKPVYFKMSQLKEVLTAYNKTQFIIMTEKETGQQVFYTYFNYYDHVKNLIQPIENIGDTDINAHLYLSELNNKRFMSFDSLINYCERNSATLTEETKLILKSLYQE